MLDDKSAYQPMVPDRDNTFTYDVFVSYSDTDTAWVCGELLPHLQSAHIQLITPINFEAGAPITTEFERAVSTSRKTLLILTPAYLQDQWAEFGVLIVHTLDPASRVRRFIPIIKEACDLPLRLRGIVAIDCTSMTDWSRLIAAVQSPLPKQNNLPIYTNVPPLASTDSISKHDIQIDDAMLHDAMVRAFTSWEQIEELCLELDLIWEEVKSRKLSLSITRLIRQAHLKGNHNTLIQRVRAKYPGLLKI